MLEWTGERYVPWIPDAEIGYEHLHRYAFATQFVRNKRVLDLACGEGYGSNLLAQTAKQIIGIDSDPATIEHAKHKYIKASLEFKTGSITGIPISGEHLFDVIVCFEALEHVEDHHKLLGETKRLLAPNGLLFVSTPNKMLYTDEDHFNNPFHVHELYFDEFRALLENYFKQVKFLGQRIFCNSSMWPVFPEKRIHSSEFVIERTPKEFAFVQPEKRSPIYFLAVASNSAKDIGGHISCLVDISNELVGQRDRTITEKVNAINQLTKEREELKTAVSGFVDHTAQLKATIQAHQKLLAQRQDDISKLTGWVKEKEGRISELTEGLRKTQDRVAQDVAWLQSVVADREKVIAAKQEEISRLAVQVAVLDGIYSSHGWKVLTIYCKIRDRLLPPNTFRRKVIRGFFRSLVAFHASLTSKEPAAAASGLVAATAAPAGGNEQPPAEAVEDGQPPSEPQNGTAPQPYSLNTNDVAGENEEAQYQALSGRIAGLRKSRIENLQLTPPPLISIPESEFVSNAEALFFPPQDDVQVSIIIPVFNNLKYTLECLTSIQKCSRGIPYEVIVVDDASTDRTPEVLSYVSNIVYISNLKNLGFVRTCNLGAETARGKYILFLNSDTQVTSNWLEPLVDTFEKYTDVGAVGPKLLFPDGRLQEAGALVNRDCTSKLIGLFDDPGLARYNYTREVMYCSGACLLVDAKTFRELGGFDTGLAPAYCEDWDLAFRLRSRGLRVMYNPESVVIHHLSVTANGVDQDFKIQCVVRNQQKLSEKWQHEIDRLNDIRLIAFYLPQFHPIPENDRWWGKGFTDWINVAKARPNYAGHYQPHVPADLGFYDLRVEEIMDEQAELAKRYGLYGFCYFYYWFAGKRLLDLPLEKAANKNKPNNRFCIAWANENWTRTWDGLESEVLIGQQHSDEDDRAVIVDMIRYLRQANYIRIKGKPLLLVYRINLFPDIKRTTEIWREQCLKEGIGDIYLALVESFENAGASANPGEFGFDASVEFPPHQMSCAMVPPLLVNPDFEGVVHDYREVVLKYLQLEIPGHVRFRSVMPSWDNTPRRQNNPHIFEYARPGAYQAWLEAILGQTHELNFGEERIVFINAWNEWGEGNHLEPDRRHGHGFLEATRNARDAWLLNREQVPS